MYSVLVNKLFAILICTMYTIIINTDLRSMYRSTSKSTVQVRKGSGSASTGMYRYVRNSYTKNSVYCIRYTVRSGVRTEYCTSTCTGIYPGSCTVGYSRVTCSGDTVQLCILALV